MTSPEEQIAAVLTAHERYEWWPMTREFICTCETSLGRSYPDPAHKNHIASALVAAGIGVVTDARAAGATAVLHAVEAAGAYRLEGIAWQMLQAAQAAARVEIGSGR